MAQVIVIFNSKGGVGKTFLAVNLAVALSKNQRMRVCLLDFDLEASGDMARMLNAKPQKTFADLINHHKSFPKTQLNRLEFVSSVAGVDFIPAVIEPQQSPSLDVEHIPAALNSLSAQYDYIIVDGGKTFGSALYTLFNCANLVLLVCTPDILSVYQTKWVMDTMQSTRFPLALLKLVLNRAESMSSISSQEIKFNFPIDIIARIPSEGKLVGEAINQGVPVITHNPRSKIALAISVLARALAEDDKFFVKRGTTDQLVLIPGVVQKTGALWETLGVSRKPEQEDISTSQQADPLSELKRAIHTRLIQDLNLKKLELKVFGDVKLARDLRSKAEVMVTNLLTQESGVIIGDPQERTRLVKEIIDEALGYGPLEDLLGDAGINDIMVNNKDEIYIERSGRIVRAPKHFASNEQVRVIIDRILAPLGRRIDESAPMVDARLPDGSRVNAIIPPLALTGPTLTIRKFRKERYKINELIGLRTLDSNMAEFLKGCVLARKNIIVSGGTGSGKTTVLNVMSEYVPAHERIVTIEDAAELKLIQEHWVRLESRLPNIEGKGAVTIRDLFRNTLRMRPDRIIIGECRGIETLDMLQAMNTGHDGSMTTIHANSTHDVLSRLDSMILMSSVDLPIRAIREMIASAIDLIVHTARLSDGTRKITQITEVAGMKDDMHIALHDIFTFRQTGLDQEERVLGTFHATGYTPTFADELRVKGVILPDRIFEAT